MRQSTSAWEPLVAWTSGRQTSSAYERDPLEIPFTQIGHKLYRVRQNSMPKIKIYCKGTICRRCVLAAIRTVKLGMTECGKQAKPLEYYAKKLFHTNLEQMFKRTSNDLDTQPTTTQQRMTCAFKNVRLLSDGCFCLKNTVNKILFRISWRRGF